MFLRCDRNSFQVVGADARKLRGLNPAVLGRETIKFRLSAKRSRALARVATLSTGDEDVAAELRWTLATHTAEGYQRDLLLDALMYR